MILAEKWQSSGYNHTKNPFISLPWSHHVVGRKATSAFLCEIGTEGVSGAGQTNMRRTERQYLRQTIGTDRQDKRQAQTKKSQPASRGDEKSKEFFT